MLLPVQPRVLPPWTARSRKLQSAQVRCNTIPTNKYGAGSHQNLSTKIMGWGYIRKKVQPIWAKAHMGQGPYGPGPYGPRPIWATKIFILRQRTFCNVSKDFWVTIFSNVTFLTSKPNMFFLLMRQVVFLARRQFYYYVLTNRIS